MSDSLLLGVIAVLSSSTKSSGSLSAVVRNIATGMREPLTGVAYTNTVSVGATLAAKSLTTLTRPLMLLADSVDLLGLSLAARAGIGGRPSLSRASAMARSSSAASGEFASTSSRARSQKRKAER